MILFNVGDEVVYHEPGNFEYRTVWGVSPDGRKLWLKPPNTNTGGSPYNALATQYRPYVRELKVGDKVRLRKTFEFMGEQCHVGCMEPKIIRYISEVTVVYEIFGSSGSSFGETAVGRDEFDREFEADPT